MSNASERRRGEPDGATRPEGDAGIEDRTTGPSRTSRDDVNASRAASPAQEKDQGFNESHGYPPGHGGPTSPGDAPAKGAPPTKKDAADGHDPSKRGAAKDAEPDRK